MLVHALSITTAAVPVPGVWCILGPLACAPWHAYGSQESHSEEPLALKTPLRRALPASSPNKYMSCLVFQQNEAKLDEILKELKSIKDTITNQDERISKLEQQMAKIADWAGRAALAPPPAQAHSSSPVRQAAACSIPVRAFLFS